MILLQFCYVVVCDSLLYGGLVFFWIAPKEIADVIPIVRDNTIAVNIWSTSKSTATYTVTIWTDEPQINLTQNVEVNITRSSCILCLYLIVCFVKN